MSKGHGYRGLVIFREGGGTNRKTPPSSLKMGEVRERIVLSLLSLSGLKVEWMMGEIWDMVFLL